MKKNTQTSNWLENYNDSKATASPDMVGDGFSNVGRKFSPAWGGQFQMGGKLKSNIPVIEDVGDYNEEGYWVPDWEAMTAQAKKLGAKRVKTKHGSLIVFDNNWEVIGVDDNPDAMQMGGNVYPVNYVPQAQNGEFKIDFSKGPAGEMKEDINKSKKKKETPIQKEQNVTVKESTKVNKNIPTKIEQKKQWAPEDVSKLNIPEQVTRQIDYTKYWDDPKQNFAVVDKDSNVMYYVNPLGQIIGHENIVTGATNKDEENAPSMLEYGKTANEYYDYLKNTNQRVTPEGVFTLRSNKNNSVGKPHSLWDRAIGALPFTDDVRLNTLDDPSLLHAVYNEMPWREEEKKEYYDHRKESYGPTGNMLRMISQYGVPSSKGLHGTGNVNRIKALDTPGADRNLSNGCINVGGRTKCFDILGDKAKLYVMPEAKDESGFKNVTSSKNQLYSKFGHYDDSDKKNWVEDEDLKISREEIKAAKETKNKIANIIKKNKINATPEEIDFVAAVAQKETKGGESWLSKAESVLPGFSSYGLYEQKESFPYLKGKSPNDEVASTQAVIDFYRDMHKKHPDLEFDFYPNEQIYSTYNSGKEDWDESGIYHGKDFRKVLQAVKGYENGGSLPGATGNMYARYAQGGDVDYSYPRTKDIPSEGPYAKKTLPSAQNGQEMSYYQNGLDWKPKTISREGSIIKDDMGYWNPENWDSPVEIGSNNITMQDVPFDVLGISDEGDVQHMKANSPKNYKYKGNKVTEFRMAKNGMRQEQKGLVNLDQLTNWSNYNTKQKGGWLDNL